MYRWIDHTAELELAIEADSEEAVLQDALAALSEVLGEGERGEPVRFEFSLQASDRPALLVEWLSELVFLAETEQFVPERAEVLAIADASLQATVEGYRGDPPHLVKAVTYHRLRFEPAGGGWEARVVFDV